MKCGSGGLGKNRRPLFTKTNDEIHFRAHLPYLEGPFQVSKLVEELEKSLVWGSQGG